jgi:hypothetical protein
MDMKASRFTEEQIIRVLPEQDTGSDGAPSPAAGRIPQRDAVHVPCPYARFSVPQTR